MMPQLARSDSCSWVHVTHLPKLASEDWLRGLFVPIGTATDVLLSRTESSVSAQVRFGSAEQAAAALQYDGFRTLGQTIRVFPKAADNILQSNALLDSFSQDPMQAGRQRLSRSRRESDPSKTYRNLYVGNLPLNVNTDQLAALFAQYGTVTHCVILSTLDTQARRRGFIVMASPDESRLAIKGLNGFVWYGYPIEVSFALVQRSGGPLDPEGESTVTRNVPRSRYNTGPRKGPDVEGFFSSVDEASVARSSPSDYTAVSSTTGQKRGHDEVEDPNSIIVSGLDPVAVIDNDDLMRIMLTYGPVAAATLCRDDRGSSRGFGIVTFEKEQDATRACAQLNQRDIHGRRLRAQRYVYSNASQSVSQNPSIELPWRSTRQALPFSVPVTPVSPPLAKLGEDRSIASSMHAPQVLPLPYSSLSGVSSQTPSLINGVAASRSQAAFDPVRASTRGEGELAALLNSMKLGKTPSGTTFATSPEKAKAQNAEAATPSARVSTLDFPPNLFQPTGKSTPVSTRPDPLDMPASIKPSDLAKAPELGAAFEQREKRNDKDDTGSFARPDRSTENDSSAGLRTGISLSPWSTNSGHTSHTVPDRFSPQNTLYTPSPSSSCGLLLTPEHAHDRKLSRPPPLAGAVSSSATKSPEEDLLWKTSKTTEQKLKAPESPCSEGPVQQGTKE